MGGEDCTCNLPYTDMKVVKVRSFTGASFRYKRLCPACGGAEPLTISTLVRFVAFIALVATIGFVLHERKHGYSATLAILRYLNSLVSLT